MPHAHTLSPTPSAGRDPPAPGGPPAPLDAAGALTHIGRHAPAARADAARHGASHAAHGAHTFFSCCTACMAAAPALNGCSAACFVWLLRLCSVPLFLQLALALGPVLAPK